MTLALLATLGCSACHGEHGPFRDRLKGAVGRSDAELAAWIRDPQSVRPGAQMPAFKEVLPPAQAEAPGRYVRELAEGRPQ